MVHLVRQENADKEAGGPEHAESSTTGGTLAYPLSGHTSTGSRPTHPQSVIIANFIHRRRHCSPKSRPAGQHHWLAEKIITIITYGTDSQSVAVN